MKKRKSCIRFDEYTWKLLNQLSTKACCSTSVIVRSMVIREINKLINKSTDKIDETNVSGRYSTIDELIEELQRY